MAVLVKMTSVLVRVPVLEARFPGGLAGFERAVFNETFCTDGELARAAFMGPRDVFALVEQLIAAGIGAEEIAVVDMFTGPWSPTPWLSVDLESEPAKAWVEGGDASELALPATDR